MSYKQISYGDIVRLETYIKAKMSQAEIRIKLGRDKSTISRLISSNIDEDKVFRAESAWEKICERKKWKKGENKILDNELIESYVLEKIHLYWTPEQIAQKWREKSDESLCHETIYQYIYKHQPKLVKVYLARKGKRYRSAREKKEKYGIPNMRMIDERPEIVEQRKRIGDWEGDTMIGKDHKQAIVVNVERRSGLLFAKKVPRKTAQNIADVTQDLFAELPDELALTITYDQGSEFAWHQVIATENKMAVYFCHKACPWQKGSVENTIGLLRRFIPKSTDFDSFTAQQLQEWVDLINDRPRKRHKYLTPNEVFYQNL
jgi:IS30 family transposase